MKSITNIRFILSLVIFLLIPSSTYSYNFPKDEDTPYGVKASRPDFEDLGELKIPKPMEDGKIPTLNKTGFMTPDQSPYTEQFIEFASQCKYPILDVGAAYGLASLRALEKGATVIANDIDERHLLLLREQARADLRDRLILNNKRFPDETRFPKKSLSAILISRVAHFWNDKDMEQAIPKMKKWLIPGGRIYIVTMSPHHHLLTNFLPLYNQRVKDRVPWPGIIPNMYDYVPDELREKIPPFLHVMDSHSLGVALIEMKFNILKESLFDFQRPNSKKSDGKGYYGVIAEKSNITVEVDN